MDVENSTEQPKGTFVPIDANHKLLLHKIKAILYKQQNDATAKRVTNQRIVQESLEKYHDLLIQTYEHNNPNGTTSHDNAN